MQAAQLGLAEAVEMLLEAGASAEACATLALQGGYTEVGDLLARPNLALAGASEQHDRGYDSGDSFKSYDSAQDDRPWH